MIMPPDTGTRVRLLHAARKVFAEHGRENATIREICSLAKANVAAVNYHFGSKEKLYVAVLQDFLERENERHPRDEGITPQSSPLQRLRVYIRSFLLQTLGDGDKETERLGKLLMQEFIEPTQYFGEIFEKQCRPSHNLLLDIVRHLLPGHDEMAVTRSASSIIGQCVLFEYGKEAMNVMTPELALKAGNIELITDFIVEFSVGGLNRLNSTRQVQNMA